MRSTLMILLASLIIGVPQAAAQRGDDGEEMPEELEQITLEFAAFSEDSREFSVFVTDELRGDSFQVFDTKKGKLKKTYPVDEGRKKAVWRKVKRKHAMKQDGVPNGENLKKEITIMGNQKRRQLVLYVMKGERIRPYTKIDLPEIKIRRKRKPVQASVKEIVFDQKGKYFVVIYHQKVSGTYPYESDKIRSFKFKSYKAKFGAPEE